jgi:hypothetical protein
MSILWFIWLVSTAAIIINSLKILQGGKAAQIWLNCFLAWLMFSTALGAVMVAELVLR